MAVLVASKPMLAIGLVLLCAESVLAQDTSVETEGWAAFLSRDFYHMLIVPLMLATCVMGYAAKPSTTDEVPDGFHKFQYTYMVVWALCVAADWLQGPYVYALYAAYGFDSHEIAELFVAGFGSSLVFGCFVGTFTDKFGRKKCCILYCILYILSCMTKHFRVYSVLMIGRVTGGIATSMLFSCFECWMVSEHLQRHNFSGGLLGYMFGMMFQVMYLVAIASGLAGQAVADAFTFGPISEGSSFYTGGYCCPFDLAIACLVVGIVLIAMLFEENYGNTGSGDATSGLLENIQSGMQLLMKDRRALLLGVVVSAFEGSMFAFVFNWTPALDSETVKPPHGVIFALFMMACMCGASLSTLAGNIAKPGMRLLCTFGAGFLSFTVASHAASRTSGENLGLSLSAFLLFEFCVGVYFPSVGVLKSEVVPESVRGTVYNLYRVPLNAIVVGLLLSSISMTTCFRLNAMLLLIAFASMAFIAFAPSSSAGIVGVGNKDRDTELGKPSYDQVPADAGNSESVGGATVVGRRRVHADEAVMRREFDV